MRLRIITPLSVVVDDDGVLALRAEDASGGFGILPRHADFLTSLTISVVGWKGADGTPHFCACSMASFPLPEGSRLPSRRARRSSATIFPTLDRIVLARFPRRYRNGAGGTYREHASATECHPPDHAPPAAGQPQRVGIFRMDWAPRNDPGDQDPLVKGVRLRGERHRRWLREGDPSVARRLAQIGVLGWIIVTPILIGIFLGRWLDKTFNSDCSGPRRF